jgi:flagellar hook-associated protein 2
LILLPETLKTPHEIADSLYDGRVVLQDVHMALLTFSGIASGIDSSSLIKSLMDQQRKLRIQPLEKKKTDYTETNTALSEFSSLLETLKSKADKFRALGGGALSKTTSSSNEGIVTASGLNSAANGTYEVTTTSLAKSATVSFNDRFLSTSTAINGSINDGAAAADRTVTVAVGTGSDLENISVELTSTTTAEQFVSTFNSKSTRAQASLVNVGTNQAPSYAIVLNSTQEGTAKGQLSVSVGSEIRTAGTGAFQGSTTSQAANTVFTVSGINGTITRPSRTVTDVVPGVTFSMHSLGSATVSVSDDTSTTTSALQEFVDAYNEVITFAGEQDLVTTQESNGEKTSIFGPLASTQLDENVLSGLRSALSGSTTSGFTHATLADLGITTQRDGTLKLDTTVAQSALSTDPSGARAILEKLGETLAKTDGTIAQFTRYNGLIDLAEQSNTGQVNLLNDKISEIETQLAKQEQALVSQFARLESLIGQLNSQQNSLSSLLPR